MKRKQSNLKNYAFQYLNNAQEPPLEEVIDQSDEESLPSFSEHDFGIDDISEGEIRELSGKKLLVINILNTYRTINQKYSFKETVRPQFNLTSPCEGVKNGGKDNREDNLIVYINDEIKGPKCKYTIIELLGQGISGQVFKAESNGKYYALKVIRNRKAYLTQALIEMKILEKLNNEVDKNNQYHIIRMIDYFYYFEHMCIVFELLNENLYQLLQHNNLRGISLNPIRFIIKEILEAVEQFHRANIIHCDLKPENILFTIDKNAEKKISIKVIDFGSACWKGKTIFKYIQSRYYRAPEVMISKPYSTEIDIWSIGCIAAELYLGLPIFPGSCEFDQLKKIVSILGNIPDYLIHKGRNKDKYFTTNSLGKLVLKTDEQYYKENPKDEMPRYETPYDLSSLDDLINIKKDSGKLKESSHNSFSLNSSTYNEDLCAFIHFLKGVLQLDPQMRWNAKQCLRHPFLTKEKLDKFLSFHPDQVSQFMYQSNESSQPFNKMNYNPCLSLMMSDSFYQYNMMGQNHNMSYTNNMHYNCPMMTNSFGSFVNVSYDNFVFQPNLQNIKMNWVRNFPYALVGQCNINPKMNKGNQNNKMRNTFMNTTFEKINNSNDYYYYQNKRNKISNKKNNKQFNNKKGKYKRKSYNSKNNQNFIDKSAINDFKYLSTSGISNNKLSDKNVGLFKKSNNSFYSGVNDQNLEYEGLGRNDTNMIGAYMTDNNYIKRMRSQSDYNSNIALKSSINDSQRNNNKENNKNNEEDKNK